VEAAIKQGSPQDGAEFSRLLKKSGIGCGAMERMS
jgi:hypothetical protein